MERNFHRAGRALLLLVACSLTAHPVRAQDPPTPPPPEAANDIPAATKKSPLVAEPKTPEELFEAAILMVNVARPELAKLYLDKLLEEADNEDVLLALRDKFGAAPFVRLTNVKELKSSANKLLDLSNAAMSKRASDPQYIAKLIALLDGSPEESAAAFTELKASGVLVVPGLLTTLSDPAQASKHPTVEEAILRIGDVAIPQLVGALGAPSEEMRADVMSLLGRLRAKEAVPFLWYPATSAEEKPAVQQSARFALARILNVPPENVIRLAAQGTAARLLQTAREHYRNEYTWHLGGKDTVTVWTWDAAQNTIVAAELPPEIASENAGLQFARQALSLASEQRPMQVMYLSLTLAHDIRTAGFDKPLPVGPGTAHDLALSVGGDVVSDVLAEALASSRPFTAVAALKVLEQTGTVSQLKGANEKRSPIIAALNYPDPRVQFGAASLILQFDPPTPFYGAARVVDILKRAAASSTKAHAVVGEVSADRGGRIGGMLREMGYEPLVFTTGREAFTAAAERTDVELVVLHPNLIRWALSETVANLRADARTASLPIILHGPGDLRRKLSTYSTNYRLIRYASLSEETDDLDYQLRPFLAQIKTPAMTPEQQSAQRAAAVAWLAHIAAGRRMKIFDITSAEEPLSEALRDPKTAADALQAIGEIATKSSQQRMADSVLDNNNDASLREAAALKLAFHIQRFGLLLGKQPIDALHKAWEDANEPPPVRTAVGSVIGSLKPNAALVGKRLQSYAPVSP